jgi:poly-gamma-glutamate capsule biosynthesis protein CapA/YwtB (metallophosphatase superfamily)
VTSLTLALGADIIPTRRLGPFAPAVAETIGLVRAADIAIGNFEMPLTTVNEPIQKLLNIRSDPKIAEDTPSLGFGILTLANNHAVDFGWAGLQETARRLRRQQLTVVGVGENREEAAALAVREIAGRRVGVIAFSCLTPTGMGAGPERPGISALHVETAYEIDPWYQMEEPGDPSVVTIRTRVCEADRSWAEGVVRRARSACDLLVVTIHWGYGSGELLAEYQRPLAEALIDAGADVIHGHHPHAVHPVGFHRGRPILYGLGTFIGQQIFLPAPANVQTLWAGMSPDGALAELEFGDEANIALVLHLTTLNDERLPILARGPVFDRIADRFVRLSTPFGATVTRCDSHLLVAPLS